MKNYILIRKELVDRPIGVKSTAQTQIFLYFEESKPAVGTHPASYSLGIKVFPAGLQRTSR
jgi:hypothetical protein